MSPNGSKEPLKSKLKNLMPKPNGAQNELKTPELAMKSKILHVNMSQNRPTEPPKQAM